MVIHDSSGKKLGRNSKCFCGSGKKYKFCHGSLNKRDPHSVNTDIPEEVKRKIQEINTKRHAYEVAHGKSKPIISTEFKDYRIVFVGNELHYAKKETVKYFTDFLTNYIRLKIGTEWGNQEIAKDLEERHQVLKWYDSMCHFQAKQKPQEDGTYKTTANGSMLSWYRLAYDLYLIKHNSILQEKILNRLKNRQQFQGARFELCAAASMIVSGFEINFEDEDDTSRKHAEFLAKDNTGLEIAVEAKSRHRDGILEYRSSPRRSGNPHPLKVAVKGLIRKALDKKQEYPYFIFIDVNLPYREENPHSDLWFEEMAKTVEDIKQEYEIGAFPANAIFFCNDPTYQEPEKQPPGQSFWCYVIPIDNPKYPLQEPNLVMHIAQSIIKRTNIPNEYPDKIKKA